ncbi:P-loop containing nucleoside triphosphate hydrolase protein [Trametes elegans]|nr:P-loop containing nucleoside triphosphate hydrolase protein [Trametes elegans]
MSLRVTEAKRRVTATLAGQPARRRVSSKAAEKVFMHANDAVHLAGAAAPSSIPKLDGLPEVIVTGRANVGKSTLLNAVLGRHNLVHTSKKPGRTQTLNFFRVGRPPGSLVVVDAPGYGARGRPEWGELFDHYVQNRQQLRRVYFLFSAAHGMNDVDRMMLGSLFENAHASRREKFTIQPVVTKGDRFQGNAQQEISSWQTDIMDIAPSSLPLIVTAAAEHPHFGVDKVRQSIVEACGIKV